MRLFLPDIDEKRFKIMSLITLKKRALAEAEVKREYDRLESEFSLIDPLLSM